VCVTVITDCLQILQSGLHRTSAVSCRHHSVIRHLLTTPRTFARRLCHITSVLLPRLSAPHTTTRHCRCLVTRGFLTADWAPCPRMMSATVLRPAGAIDGITYHHWKPPRLRGVQPSTCQCDITSCTYRSTLLPNSFRRTIRSATAAVSKLHRLRPRFTESFHCQLVASDGMRPCQHDRRKSSTYWSR